MQRQQRKKTGYEPRQFREKKNTDNDHFWHQVFIVRKKPDKEYTHNGDIPAKYKNLWFMRKASDIRAAAIEVVSQELMRLIIPSQCKARLVEGDENGNYYVTSRQGHGFEPLDHFTNEEIYAHASKGEWKRYGECSTVAVWLDMFRFNKYLLGVDDRDNIIMYEGESCCAGLQKELKDARETYDLSAINLNLLPFLQDQYAYNWMDEIEDGRVLRTLNEKDAGVYQSKSLRHEINFALMKIVLLPDVLLTKFVHSYLPASQKICNEILHEIIRRRDDLLEAAYKNHSFCKYIQSEQARKDLDNYQKYLEEFTTVGKKHLIGGDNKIIPEMNDKYERVCKKARMQPDYISKKASEKMMSSINDYVNSMLVYKTDGSGALNWSATKLQRQQHAAERVTAMQKLADTLLRDDPPVTLNECEDLLAAMMLTEKKMHQEATYGEAFFEGGKYSRCIHALKTLIDADRNSQLQANASATEVPMRNLSK